MRVRRHIIGATVAVLVGLVAPGSASAGGVDPTRNCIVSEVSEYLYEPYSLRGATELAYGVKTCGRDFVVHLRDADKRATWEKCVQYGLSRTITSLMWDPLLDAVYSCTSRWLEFEVQIDPYP
jgi:hypothetical protein